MTELNGSILNEIESHQNIKALIFDMDGTLVDTLPVHYGAWIEACREFGVDFSMDYFRTLTGRPAKELSKDIVEKYNMPVHPYDLVQKKEALVQGQLNKLEVFPFIHEVLTHYHQKIPMSVGTGARKNMTDDILQSTKLSHYFDYIVTSDDVTQYKPHPETFLKSAEHFGIKPENCLVFEDGQLGIEAARSAGMKVVDVKNYY